MRSYLLAGALTLGVACLTAAQTQAQIQTRSSAYAGNPYYGTTYGYVGSYVRNPYAQYYYAPTNAVATYYGNTTSYAGYPATFGYYAPYTYGASYYSPRYGTWNLNLSSTPMTYQVG